MKKYIFSMFAVISLMLMPAAASASHSWFIRMSDPTTSNQIRTFNVEYTALSVVNNDQITVKLIENGTHKATQTTPGGGGSGAFSVTVPSDGQYTYRLDATSSNDGTSKSTPEKTVNVETPPGSSSSTVTVTQASSSPSSGGIGGDGGTAAGTVAAAGSPAEAGQAGTQSATGEVTQQAAASNNQGDVLGAEARQELLTKDNAPTLILSILAALGLAYYYFFRRRRAGDDDIDV